MRGNLGLVIGIAYHVASTATFVFLTFFDHYAYNAWNWLIAIPVNAVLGELWPIYWAIIRPFFS